MRRTDTLTTHFRLRHEQSAALRKLGILTVEDLLYHFPNRYGDTSAVRTIENLEVGQDAVLFGIITKLKTSKGYRSKIPMAEAVLTDETGSISLVWFHQPYVAKMIAEGSKVRIEGKVSERKKSGSSSIAPTLSMANPKIETVAKLPIAVGDSLFGKEGEAHNLYPVYPESRGVTSDWFYHALQRVFASGILDTLEDPIPGDILKRYNLPSLTTALIWVHTPRSNDDAMVARKRFAFEEIFFIQLQKQKERKEHAEHQSFVVLHDEKTMEGFLKRFPFEPTTAQRRAIDTIMQDMRGGRPMARLLEGDVGSGKTAVAASVSHAIITSRPHDRSYGALQVGYMAPTEILATQHFESFIRYFSHMPISIGLITSSGCRKFPSKLNPSGWTDISRSQFLKWVKNGDISIVIGTHSLLQKSVVFRDLALVIIDEQHRFGTKQRHTAVRAHTRIPHLLSMTATPIPRTLALTLYGDLDLTLLDEMPAGRKQIITQIVPPAERDQVYDHIRSELTAGRQIYIICPRIDEPDPEKELALNAKSVKAEAARLKKSVFPHARISTLHSKMKTEQKDQIMADFKAHTTDILVATSVVEVGVNVPNATTIIIEGAERYGLSQLHQLRGRVLRGTHQAYCFLFPETMGQKTADRLRAIEKAKNGFELAEYDLQLRGAGELYGRKQWGLSDIAMESLKNIKMVEAARAEARTLIETDGYKNYPLIVKYLADSKNTIHFE